MVLVVGFLLRLNFNFGVSLAQSWGDTCRVYLPQLFYLTNGLIEQYSRSEFLSRYMVWLPLVPVVKLWGFSHLSLLSWELITATLNISLVFYISKMLFNKRIALIAALITVFMPVYINQIRLLPDTGLLFFNLLFILAYLKVKQKKQVLFWFLVISASLFLGQKVKPNSFFVLLLGAADLYRYLWSRVSNRSRLLLVLLPIIAYMGLFREQLFDPASYGYLLNLLKFNWGQRLIVFYLGKIGLILYLFISGLFFADKYMNKIKWQEYKTRILKYKDSLSLITLFLLFLYMLHEFVLPVHLGGGIPYFVYRYYMLLFVPLIILFAFVLEEIFTNVRMKSVALVVVVVALSIVTCRDYQDSLRDFVPNKVVNEVAEVFDKLPRKSVYSNSLSAMRKINLYLNNELIGFDKNLIDGQKYRSESANYFIKSIGYKDIELFNYLKDKQNIYLVTFEDSYRIRTKDSFHILSVTEKKVLDKFEIIHQQDDYKIYDIDKFI